MTRSSIVHPPEHKRVYCANACGAYAVDAARGWWWHPIGRTGCRHRLPDTVMPPGLRQWRQLAGKVQARRAERALRDFTVL